MFYQNTFFYLSILISRPCIPTFFYLSILISRPCIPLLNFPPFFHVNLQLRFLFAKSQLDCFPKTHQHGLFLLCNFFLLPKLLFTLDSYIVVLMQRWWERFELWRQLSETQNSLITRENVCKFFDLVKWLLIEARLGVVKLILMNLIQMQLRLVNLYFEAVASRTKREVVHSLGHALELNKYHSVHYVLM